jgi:hypothetical protein
MTMTHSSAKMKLSPENKVLHWTQREKRNLVTPFPHNPKIKNTPFGNSKKREIGG